MWLKLCSIVAILVITIGAMVPIQTSAAGLGVSPKELKLDAVVGDSATDTLYVVNITGEESYFYVYPEDGYEDWFEISPEEFSLTYDQSKEVEVKLSSSLDALGEHTANICVVSVNPVSALEVGSGIKVPTKINIMEAPDTQESFPVIVAVIVGSAFLIALFGVTLFMLRRKVTH